MVGFHYRSSSKYVILNDVESVVRLVCSNCTYFNNHNSQLCQTDIVDLRYFCLVSASLSVFDAKRAKSGGWDNINADGQSKIVPVSPA